MSSSESVCVASSVGSEIFMEQCSLDERCGGFQDLEQFWDAEKLRLNDYDGQKPITSSWEEHFLNDEALVEPSPKKEGPKEFYTHNSELTIVTGETIKDIPTSYVVSGFEPQELIVIGTYVDKKITPGFRYKVRKNLSDEHLFDGKALPLENVGLGYGKRLTFQGDTLNDNHNYFWSDSRTHGFGFTLQTLHPKSAFVIMDTTGQIGRVVVNNPALSPDDELTTWVSNGGRIEKTVRVNFNCDVTLSGGNSNIFVEDLPVRGLAFVVRNGPSDVAKAEKIDLEDFVMEGCYLLPEE